MADRSPRAFRRRSIAGNGYLRQNRFIIFLENKATYNYRGSPAKTDTRLAKATFFVLKSGRTNEMKLHILFSNFCQLQTFLGFSISFTFVTRILSLVSIAEIFRTDAVLHGFKCRATIWFTEKKFARVRITASPET